MGLRIVTEECSTEGMKHTVVVEGDSFEEVTGMEARKFALEQGPILFGWPACGISGASGPYPAGMDQNNPTKLADARGRKYRNDIVLAERL